MIIYEKIKKERSTLRFLWKGRNSKTALNQTECLLLFVCVFIFPLQIRNKAKKKTKERTKERNCLHWSVPDGIRVFCNPLCITVHADSRRPSRPVPCVHTVYSCQYIWSLLWNDVYISFQTLDIVYALDSIVAIDFSLKVMNNIHLWFVQYIHILYKTLWSP